MAATISLRDRIPADDKWIAQLIRSDYNPEIHTRLPPSPAEIAAVNGNPTVHCLIAELDGERSGYVTWTVHPTEFEVNSLAVDQKYRRRGIAKRLMQGMLAQVEGMPGTIGILKKNPLFPHLERFYHECGFCKKIGESPGGNCILLGRV